MIQFVTQGSPIPDGHEGDSPTLCEGLGKHSPSQKRHNPRVGLLQLDNKKYKSENRVSWMWKNITCAPPEGLPKNHRFCRGGFGLVQGGQPKMDATVLCKKRGRRWGGTICIFMELVSYNVLSNLSKPISMIG